MIIIDILTQHEVELASRAARRALSRGSAVATAVLQHRTPVLLRHLANAMGGSNDEIQRLGQSAARHGHDVMRNGCSIAHVVHAYGDIYHAVTDLAHSLQVALPAEELERFQTLLEDALACAASEYDRQQLASASQHSAAHWRTFEYEFRQLLNVAMLCFDGACLSGTFDLNPSAKAVGRSIQDLTALLERSPESRSAYAR